MKENLHPKVHNSTITCASCGSVYPLQSTRQTMRIDLCSNCHPFYTGQQRIVDTAGQVDRFMRRFQAAQQRQQRPAPAPQAQDGQEQPAKEA